MEQQTNLERYGTIRAWTREFGLSQKAVEARLRSLRGITGKLFQGNVLEEGFYSESDVCNLCADLFENWPAADENGFFLREEEGKQVRYGTVYAWAATLKVSAATIEKRLGDVKGITAKNRRGALIKGGFYSEDMVRSACGDLLTDMPVADASGFSTATGASGGTERFATIEAWSRALGVSRYALQQHLTQHQGIDGKDAAGNVRQKGFFGESVVSQECGAITLLLQLPQADASGFFIHDNQTYGSIAAWARHLAIGEATIKKRLQAEKGITARDKSGHVLKNGFFAEEQVKQVLDNLLRTGLPQTDASGFFLSSGERHGAIKAWSSEFGLHFNTVKKRLAAIEGIDGKDGTGRMREKSFYAESIVRNACADLLRELPTADAEGCIAIEGIRFATCNAWMRKIGISEITLRKKLSAAGANGLTAKDTGGHVLEKAFFSESDVRKACENVRSHSCDDGEARI